MMLLVFVLVFGTSFCLVKEQVYSFPSNPLKADSFRRRKRPAEQSHKFKELFSGI